MSLSQKRNPGPAGTDFHMSRRSPSAAITAAFRSKPVLIHDALAADAPATTASESGSARRPAFRRTGAATAGNATTPRASGVRKYDDGSSTRSRKVKITL